MNRNGIGILDVIIWTAIVGVTMTTVSGFIKQPTLLKSQLDMASAQQTGLSAMDIVLNDLKEADASSVPFTTLLPNGTLTTGLGWFRKINFNSSPPFTYVQYEYSPNGSLLRDENSVAPQMSGSTQTVVVSQIAAPTTTDPIFMQDPNTPNVLVLTLLYQPPAISNTSPIRLVYRVSVRGE